jgi:hypothetical protein
MKKKLLGLFFLSGLSLTSFAQPCTGGRYATDVFTESTKTANLQYGQNVSFNGSNTNLTLDFYEPTGDTETKRPLIILAHGGSFQFGSSSDGDITYLCETFAKKGFACASINYRKGFFPLDSVNAVRAVLRAVQDMKAAVRYFYKDSKEGINQFKIDTNNIFVGGSSAGAITALHLAYLDKSCELNPYIPQTALDGLGGIEGNSGNPCYSSKVKGVINLCGALASYGWLEAGDLPFVSVHGTMDETVKYNRGLVNPGVPLIYLDGSRVLFEQAEAIGVGNKFFTFRGAPHVPYTGNQAYMDTTVNIVRDYLVERLGCSVAPLQLPNTPSETANLYPYTPCTTSIQTDYCGLASVVALEDELELAIYPNPASENMHVSMKSTFDQKLTVQIFDLMGRNIWSKAGITGNFELNKSEIGQGSYLLRIEGESGDFVVKTIVFQ